MDLAGYLILKSSPLFKQLTITRKAVRCDNRRSWFTAQMELV
jgi:hypothetical protein